MVEYERVIIRRNGRKEREEKRSGELLEQVPKMKTGEIQDRTKKVDKGGKSRL